VQTPFGDLDPRRSARMSMAEIDDALKRPVSRRALGKGALLAGAASPLLWVKPGYAAVPPAGTHLTFGADPSTEVVVSWSTEGAVKSPSLQYGTSKAYGTNIAVETRTVRGSTAIYHHARLTRLLPGTTYHYRLTHAGGSTPDRTFRTASTDPKRAFRFTAFGDQGVNANAAATAARIAAVMPAFHVHAGDLCYANSTGIGGENQTYDATAWDRWMTQNLVVSTQGVPWMPTVGNHEMEPGLGPQGYDGFLGRFVLPRNGAPGAPNTWWFRYGNVAVVGLDGNDASYEIAHNQGWLGARQDTWLRQTLTTLRKDKRVDFVVVAFHNCMYCSNAVHASDGGVRSRWEPIFDEFAVDLVVNGHNHSYERTHPLKGGHVSAVVPSGGTVTPATHGTTYITAGGGGQSGYPVNLSPASYVVAEDGTKVPELATWSAVSTEDYNVMVADVTPLTAERTATMRLRTVKPDGTLIDEVTLVRPARAGLQKPPTTAPVRGTTPAVAAPPGGPPPRSGERLAATGGQSTLAAAGATAVATAAAVRAVGART
jgi:hypothetical protein